MCSIFWGSHKQYSQYLLHHLDLIALCGSDENRSRTEVSSVLQSAQFSISAKEAVATVSFSLCFVLCTQNEVAPPPLHTVSMSVCRLVSFQNLPKRSVPGSERILKPAFFCLIAGPKIQRTPLGGGKAPTFNHRVWRHLMELYYVMMNCWTCNNTSLNTISFTSFLSHHGAVEVLVVSTVKCITFRFTAAREGWSSCHYALIKNH